MSRKSNILMTPFLKFCNITIFSKFVEQQFCDLNGISPNFLKIIDCLNNQIDRNKYLYSLKVINLKYDNNFTNLLS